MTPLKIAGIVLVILGVLGLAREGFSYTKDTHKADIGPLKISVDERKTVHVPMWAGVAVIVVGIGLLSVPAAKRS